MEIATIPITRLTAEGGGTRRYPETLTILAEARTIRIVPSWAQADIILLHTPVLHVLIAALKAAGKEASERL